MIGESGAVQIVITSATVVGFIGYIIHSTWMGYQKFKDNVWLSLDKKREKNDCDKAMALAEKVVERVDRDVQRLQEAKKL
jgi:hypothetical protein